MEASCAGATMAYAIRSADSSLLHIVGLRAADVVQCSSVSVLEKYCGRLSVLGSQCLLLVLGNASGHRGDF